MRGSRIFSWGGVHARRGKMIQRDFSNNDAIYDRGGPTFFQGGGVQLFPGGVKMLISIEPHITCDFSGGSTSPIPPLDPHMSLLHMQTLGYSTK